MTTLLKTCRISPPAGGAAEITVSLTYLDIIWLRFHPIRRLLFYEYPCTIPDFVETIVPKLEHSLSLTLSHILPIAGNLLYPSDTQKMSLIRYVAGDSVSLVVAESSNDFDELVGNHARDADQFYDLIPQMPAVVDDGECKILPVFALQVTLFPGRGICVGFANHQSLGDASSIVGFMQAWASINGDDGLDPPVPANYFGNCLGYGIVSAAEGTADEIKNRVNKTNELLKDPENWMKDMRKFKDARIMGVSGSPKFDLPNVDFGWGKARKLEVISIDKERYSMSLCKSMKFQGGLEIGLSLPKEIMEAFSLVFFHGLRS